MKASAASLIVLFYLHTAYAGLALPADVEDDDILSDDTNIEDSNGEIDPYYGYKDGEDRPTLPTDIKRHRFRYDRPTLPSRPSFVDNEPKPTLPFQRNVNDEPTLPSVQEEVVREVPATYLPLEEATYLPLEEATYLPLEEEGHALPLAGFPVHYDVHNSHLAQNANDALHFKPTPLVPEEGVQEQALSGFPVRYDKPNSQQVQNVNDARWFKPTPLVPEEGVQQSLAGFPVRYDKPNGRPVQPTYLPIEEGGQGQSLDGFPVHYDRTNSHSDQNIVDPRWLNPNRAESVQQDVRGWPIRYDKVTRGPVENKIDWLVPTQAPLPFSGYEGDFETKQRLRGTLGALTKDQVAQQLVAALAELERTKLECNFSKMTIEQIVDMFYHPSALYIVDDVVVAAGKAQIAKILTLEVAKQKFLREYTYHNSRGIKYTEGSFVDQVDEDEQQKYYYKQTWATIEGQRKVALDSNVDNVHAKF